jgi:hypothetical protein
MYVYSRQLVNPANLVHAGDGNKTIEIAAEDSGFIIYTSKTETFFLTFEELYNTLCNANELKNGEHHG